jgi:DNA-binding transcriptional LysR family regulator
MNQFEDMQTFIRIVEAGSITKAAEQMSTVKSAISRRLSELEKRLGVNLLTRTTRTQTLTDSGQSYYEQCLRLIEDVAEIESRVKNEHCALSGRIKIAAPLSFGLTHLAPALRQFNLIHPEINFDLDFNDRKVDLIEEGFDLAIRISNLTDSSLIARRITSGRGILAASPDYLKKYGYPTKPQDLSEGHVKLRYNLAPDNWQFKDANEKAMVIKVPSVVTANNGDYLCQEAVAGKGLLFTPDFICYKAIKMGQLIQLLTDYTISDSINAYAIYPQTRHLSKRVRSLVDYLAHYFGDEPYWTV